MTKFNIFSFLSHPRVYIFFQSVIGAKSARLKCAKEYICPEKNWRVLDIGCGPGHITDCFPQTDYVGLDVDKAYIDYAKRKYGNRGKFICRNFDDEAIESLGIFDLVVMNGLLHHLSDDEAIEMFRRIKRVLKPRGKIVTLDGCLTERQSYITRRLLYLDRGKYVRKEKDYVALARGIFNSIVSYIRNDLMFIPYTLIIMEIRNN